MSQYNSTLFKITSQLNLCSEKVIEEDMLEKTFTTFHALNMLLQQQYQERKFQKYFELISCLLVAEKNNEILFKKNQQSRLTSSIPFPEVNRMPFKRNGATKGRGHGDGKK